MWAVQAIAAVPAGALGRNPEWSGSVVPTSLSVRQWTPTGIVGSIQRGGLDRAHGSRRAASNRQR